ncbi:hypothetical protein HZB60_03325 [candidate division KSB1 bacterium]|nr:hypothetical protein [candidate division KSB1 bacterium]
MRIYRPFLAAAAMLMICSIVSYADNIANHTVTVQVDVINELEISGGNITLTISTATAGQNPDDATNNTCGLQWTTNEATKKITVVTDQSSPNFTLKVVATGVTGGTAAAEATLSSTVADDFVTGISTTLGSCTVGYTAQATAAQGNGSVVHTVTYTLTAG